MAVHFELEDIMWWAVCFMVAAVVLTAWKQYAKGGVCHSTNQMDGKTVIVTGSNTGMGKEVAAEMASRGARVIMACRSVERGNQAVADIRQKVQNGTLIVRQLDLASMKSVRKFCETICASEQCLDVLINNAGVFFCPYMLTEDGYEYHFGINHLGHFLLTNLLLDLLKQSQGSRVVNVSSFTHRYVSLDFTNLNSKHSYNRLKAYMCSKLANILFTKELARRTEGSNVSAYSLNPGAVNTAITRYLLPKWAMPVFDPILQLILKNPHVGAQTAIHCAVSDEVQALSGSYFSDCKERALGKDVMDEGISRKLWEVSEKMTGL